MRFFLFLIRSVTMIFLFFFSSRRRHTRSTRDWSSDVCSSDLLFAADGYRWNGRLHDRRDEVTALQRALPTLRATVHVTNVGLPSAAEPEPGGRPTTGDISWEAAATTTAAAPAEL